MYSHYLSTFIAKALVETLDVKVMNGTLTPMQAKFVLNSFYESIPKVFNQSVSCSMNFKAKMLSYNFVDGVWKFIAKDFGMSINNKMYRTDYIRIIAKDAETNPEVRRRRRKDK